jgi:dTDP-4-dehydrorhamnose reductase
LKIFVLGATGMLGHKFWQVFADRFDTFVTLRQGFESYVRYSLFDRARTARERLDQAVDRPQVVAMYEKVAANRGRAS